MPTRRPGLWGLRLAARFPGGPAPLQDRGGLRGPRAHRRRLAGAEVIPAPPASLAGYRTTLRLTSDGARPGFRRHRGHEVVPVDSCLVAHPLLAELLAGGDFGEATEVTLRCGARTGDRLAVLGPSTRRRLFARLGPRDR